MAKGDARPAVRSLVRLSRLDWLYADLYLNRAESFLANLCTRGHYVDLVKARASLPSLTAKLRHAAERGDWRDVRDLAEQAQQVRDSVTSDADIIELADEVYGPRLIQSDPVAFALVGLVSHAHRETARTRDAILEDLGLLQRQDVTWRSFYVSRSLYFRELHIATDDQPTLTVDAGAFRKQLMKAIDAGDYARVQRFASSAGSGASGSQGRVRVPVASNLVSGNLALPIPSEAVGKGEALGLAPQIVPAAPSLNGFLSCCCGERATFPDSPLSETNRKASTCNCGHICPPDLHGAMREDLDLLLLHPFVTSGGTRYLPWFGTEAVLVETFSETAPDAPSELLAALGLTRRTGIARTLIEDALRCHAPGVCELLGLDPVEFTISCIPFDLYARLAPLYGWGQTEQWTHFDGYQLIRELRLRALVGGDVRYGGAEDLCSVGRDYDPVRLIVRFAVLRRMRFVARATQTDGRSEEDRAH